MHICFFLPVMMSRSSLIIRAQKGFLLLPDNLTTVPVLLGLRPNLVFLAIMWHVLSICFCLVRANRDIIIHVKGLYEMFLLYEVLVVPRSYSPVGSRGVFNCLNRKSINFKFTKIIKWVVFFLCLNIL